MITWAYQDSIHAHTNQHKHNQVHNQHKCKLSSWNTPPNASYLYEVKVTGGPQTNHNRRFLANGKRSACGLLARPKAPPIKPYIRRSTQVWVASPTECPVILRAPFFVQHGESFSSSRAERYRSYRYYPFAEPSPCTSAMPMTCVRFS